VGTIVTTVILVSNSGVSEIAENGDTPVCNENPEDYQRAARTWREWYHWWTEYGSSVELEIARVSEQCS